MNAPMNRPIRSADEEDLRAFLDGDASGFERLLDRHQRPMLRFCQRLVHSTEDARDLFQEVFLQVYRSVNQLREPAAFRTWLYRIAVRRARRIQLRAGRDLNTGDSDLSHLAAPEESDPLEQREKVASLQRQLTTLPERQRECVVLRHFQGLRFNEIGAILSISEEAARASHYQGLRRLRQRLESEPSE